MKDYSAAILTIKEPGKMTPKGRKDIADWLRQQAKDLEKHGDNYTLNTFRARYIYTTKVG